MRTEREHHFHLNLGFKWSYQGMGLNLIQEYSASQETNLTLNMNSQKHFLHGRPEKPLYPMEAIPKKQPTF